MPITEPQDRTSILHDQAVLDAALAVVRGGQILATPGAARDLRQRARMSLGDVELAIGVPQSALSRYERGLGKPVSARGRLYLQFLALLEERLNAAEAAPAT